MWKQFFLHCLLEFSSLLEETEINIASNSMSNTWRTSLEGLQMTEGSSEAVMYGQVGTCEARAAQYC